jgi:hypothetical protein
MLPKIAGLVFVLLLCSASVTLASPATPSAGATVTIEDFSDIVTRLDGGFDDFSGNMGAIKAGSPPGYEPLPSMRKATFIFAEGAEQ